MSTLNTPRLSLHKSGFKQLSVVPFEAAEPRLHRLEDIPPRIIINNNHIFYGDTGMSVLDEIRRLKWITVPAYKEKRRLYAQMLEEFNVFTGEKS